MRHKLSKQDQIRGLRKALANPKLPKQFRPSMKKRLAKLLGCFLLCLFVSCRPIRAQFLGYTSPQSVQQTLGTATTCTGAAQNFIVTNLGQTQHYAYISATVGVTHLEMEIDGVDAAGNLYRISETMMGASVLGTSFPSISGSGYFPKVQVRVLCLPATGTFTLNYSGSSATFNQTAGGYLGPIIDKNMASGSPANASLNISSFIPPYGNSLGTIAFTYAGGSVAGSTITVSCGTSSSQTIFSITYSVANNTSTQLFIVQEAICPSITVSYTTGGATAATFSMDYLFQSSGYMAASVSGAVLGSALNTSGIVAEKGARWFQPATPAAGAQATVTRAAGGTGVRHVADCVIWSAGAETAPTVTRLVVNLRDGASGAGSILWATTLTAAATAAQHGNGYLCGLNLIGTANTAMTLEFAASLANEDESVTLTGYDVQ